MCFYVNFIANFQERKLVKHFEYTVLNYIIPKSGRTFRKIVIYYKNADENHTILLICKISNLRESVDE